MSAHRLALLSAFAAASTVACVNVRYQARGAPPGDPAHPATRAEGVTLRDLHNKPGEILKESEAVHPKLTREGIDESEKGSYDIDRTILLSVRVAARAPVDVLDMMWSPATAPRCAGGHPAIAILTDLEGPLNHSLAERHQVRWERPVVLRGEQVLSGRFDEDPPLLHAASVVDVRLVDRDAGAAREICVRIPMTGDGVTFQNLKRWSIGGRVSFRRALPSTPSSVLVAGLSLGRWFGPVRVGIEGIAGGTNETDQEGGAPNPDGPNGTGLCFIAPGPNCDDVLLLGGALEASGIARRGQRWAIGWSAAYETLYTRLRPVDRHAVSGGPRLGVQLLKVAPDVAGVSRLSPTNAWGLELYAAAGWTLSGTAAGAPVTYGLALLGF